jgi:tRNA threonylcarbamoyl adenosine modification protein YeaZ
MVTLGINTASRTTAIALIKGEEVLVENSWPTQNDEAEKLLPNIHSLLKKKKLDFKDLTRLVVVQGPGSFTGLRIGVTVANLIANLQKIPVHSVDTFTLLRRKNDSKPTEPIVLLAGKKEIYIQEKEGAEPTITKLEEAAEQLVQSNPSGNTVHGELLPDQAESIPNFKSSKKTFANTLKDLKPKDLKKAPKSIVHPLYIKEPSVSQPKPIKTQSK